MILFFDLIIGTAFPEMLDERYEQALKTHSLRREIIATQLSNQVVNAMGITFVYRLRVETGASIADIVKAYYVASHVYQVAEFQKTIDSLDFKIPVTQQYDLLHQVRRLLNLATRWFLRSNRLKSDIGKVVTHYANSIKKLGTYVPVFMVGSTKEYLDKITQEFIKAGLPEKVAARVAVSRALYTALNITEISTQHKFDLVKTAKIYFDVGSQFNLVWFRDQIANDSREGHWNTLARLSLRDELDAIQRQLTMTIMNSNKKETKTDTLIVKWREQNQSSLERWEQILQMLHASNSVDYVMFFIALRELAELLQVCVG